MHVQSKGAPGFEVVVGVETKTNRLFELAKKHEYHPMIKTLIGMHRIKENGCTARAVEIMVRNVWNPDTEAKTSPVSPVCQTLRQEHKRFEQFIMASILVSSLILAFDNMPVLFETVCDYIFTIIFTFEAAVKISVNLSFPNRLPRRKHFA